MAAPRRFLRVILALALPGLAIETFLLARSADGMFRQGVLLAVVALLILAALWFLWAVLLALAAAGVVRGTRSWPLLGRLPARGLLLFVVAAAVLFYLGSWALFLRTGAFATFDALRFALVDYRAMTWFYVSRSEPASLSLLAVAVAAVCGILILVLRAVGRRGGPARAAFGGALLFLLLAGAAVALLLQRIGADRSDIRRTSRLETLKSRTNPWIALATSWRDSVTGERIDPILDLRELRPIDRSWRYLPGPDRPSIVFVKVESMRADVVHQRYQGTEITPNLNALADRGLEFTRAYAPSTHTDYSDVSILSSLYPLRTREHHYYKTSDPWPKTLIYDLLKPAGYATALIAAENLSWGKMDAFLRTPNLELFFDAETSGMSGRVDSGDDGIAREVREGVLSTGVLDDGPTTDVALSWIQKQVAAGRPFFLNLDLQSPHFPYQLPAGTPMPFQPSEIDFDVSFVRYPFKKTDVVRNAYYNALHEADRQLGRVTDALRAAGALENAVLVVYGDHGEAFHENGKVTHAAQPIEVVARVPCIIVAPRYLEPRRDDYPVQLIDLPPTVLSLIGWPSHPNFQGIDLFAANRPAREDRALFIHTENPLSHTDAVILGGRWKYTRDRRPAKEALYDLATDPGEVRDIRTKEVSKTATLSALLDEWRHRQLAYYAYPAFFERYYPPPPPPASRRN